MIALYILQVKEEMIENEDEDEEKRLQIVEEVVKVEVKQEVNIKKENKEVHRRPAPNFRHTCILKGGGVSIPTTGIHFIPS